jgi:myo-inositol-1(or 4)-monophosphatase
VTSEFLAVVQLAALSAGKILREKYPQVREIQAKGVQDIVTDADFAAQAAIVEMIKAHDPQAAILSEEGIEPDPQARLIWVVDPLDGTTNYARRLPVFCTSIAVVQDGQPIAGAIYDPLHDHLFAAALDRGATLNGIPIHASTTSEVDQAVVGLDWGRGAAARSIGLNWVQHVGTQVKSIRAIGSSALALCYIAAGWIDIYFHAALKPWDGAAGQIIAQEAGVQLFNHEGAPWNYVDESCVAANAELIGWAAASVNGARRR